MLKAMNGQYLCNRQITVSYAYKKDTKGERHGTPAGVFYYFSPCPPYSFVLPFTICLTSLAFAIMMVFSFELFPCDTERVLAASNPSSQKSRPHTLFASGPPTLPSGPQANGTMGAPVPPRPFVNGAVPPGPMPVVRPPPQSVPYASMQLAGQAPWQGQPQHHGQQMPPQVMPPPMQFRPPPPNMPPPPPPQGVSGISRPPPPMGMGAPHAWPPAPPPPQQMGGRPPMLQMSMPPPPPPAS